MPALRASDSDRDRTVALLREHASAGRLDVGELSERTDAALAARTVDELAALSSDLPAAGRTLARPARRRPELAVYALVIAALWVTWAATGFGHPWPVWPMLGWGLALAGGGAAWGCYGPTRRRRPA